MLDLDGTLRRQTELFKTHAGITTVYDARRWGPNIRMACGYNTYAKFQTFLSSSKCFNAPVDGNDDAKTLVTFYGSNGS